MAKRRTSGIQRRERASQEALTRRIDEPTGMALPDWRLLAIGGVLLVGVILIALVLLLGGGPSESVGTQLPDDGQAHVTQGVDCRAPTNASQAAECGENPYGTVPAASGPHWSGPANWGVYTEPQVETQLIHNLEHGGVVIWYDPDAVDAEQIAELERYVTTQVSSGISGRFRFIVSPWAGEEELPAAIVATTWRNVLEMDEVETGMLDEFTREHYGRAPEPNGGPGPPAG